MGHHGDLSFCVSALSVRIAPYHIVVGNTALHHAILAADV